MIFLSGIRYPASSETRERVIDKPDFQHGKEENNLDELM